MTYTTVCAQLMETPVAMLRLSAENPQLRAELRTLLHLSCVIHTSCTSLGWQVFLLHF